VLGRKNYAQEELDHGQAAVDQQLGAYRRLADAIAATDDEKAKAALEAFETVYFNNTAIVLDRYFVHRLRVVAGKHGNPLNEVELLGESLMNNDGVLRGNSVIKYVPDEAVVKLRPGDSIKLTEAAFERLARAFLADLKAKFR
jgi:hypothetical protein